MLQRSALALGILLWLAVARVAGADASWVARPEVFPYDLLVQRGGTLVSSDAVAWPDGRRGLIVYIKVDTSYFRCVEWRDASFRATGEVCYELAPRALPASQ